MRLSRFRALRVLNYAMLGEGAQDVCDHFVKSQGLKVLFPLFMKKHIKKLKKEFGKYFVEREQDGELNLFARARYQWLLT